VPISRSDWRLSNGRSGRWADAIGGCPAEGRRAAADHDRTDHQVQLVHQTMGQ
jgi:hypothetical protein